MGEVVQESITEDLAYGNDFGYWIAVASNWKIKDGSSGTEILEKDKGTQYAGITVYDNTVFGTQIFFIHITDLSSFVDLAFLLLRTNADGHIEDVQNIFILPDAAIDLSMLENHSAKVISDDKTFNFYTLSPDMSPTKFNTEINKITSFSDYTPKNNKCFVWPYNYLFVSNNQGSNNIYKYEDFNTEKCIFENQFSIAIGGSGRIVPKNYKGMVTNDDEALALGKYPTCAWSSDAFTNWLTQNSVNMAVSLGLTAGAVATTIATGGATTPILAATVMSVAGNIGNTIGQFNQASLLPNINGGQANGDVIWACNRNMFSFRQMRVKTEYLKIIDDYFTRFRICCKISCNA